MEPIPAQKCSCYRCRHEQKRRDAVIDSLISIIIFLALFAAAMACSKFEVNPFVDLLP